VPDRLVAHPPRDERRRPRRGEARIVDVADALQPLERVGPLFVIDARLG
jgi:hypothetical protein